MEERQPAGDIAVGGLEVRPVGEIVGNSLRRAFTAYPPTSGAGIARVAAGGHERLPETASPITERDKAPEPRAREIRRSGAVIVADRRLLVASQIRLICARRITIGSTSTP